MNTFVTQQISKHELTQLCRDKMYGILDAYFADLAEDAAVNKPETVDERYTLDLPLRIENEYREYLMDLWEKVKGEDTRTFTQIMDKRYTRMCIDSKYRECIRLAEADAKLITTWERITKSNHEDVTHFKGLLYGYSRELLLCMTADFLEEF